MAQRASGLLARFGKRMLGFSSSSSGCCAGGLAAEAVTYHTADTRRTV